MKFSIGRSPECDLVINHACVSSRHASVERDGGGTARLVDEGSSNGTFLNQPSHEIRETELRDDDIVFLSEEYQVPSNLLLRKFLAWEASGGQVRSALAIGQARRFSEQTITIGSDADNLLVLPYVDVSPHHAAITRAPDGGYTLHDLGAGLTVGGRRLAGAASPLQPNDTIEIGGVSVSASFDPRGSVITVGAERRGFYLTAREVSLAIPTALGPRLLLDKVGFSVMPGEFVGLLGPSGCGKTTLLTCLCGISPAAGVYYNGEALRGASSRVIGYVPQDDVLFAELTVRETLYYSARLRLNARISRARLLAKIDEVCAMLGLFDPAGGLDLRDTRIGSPERKTLSGGQKKRVNLALELLTDPLVLLLDEPTSGLSSGDTRVVMECLRRLADEKGIPIVITIHQPSPRVYQLLDHVLYLKAGRMAWFGPAVPDSVRYFVPEEDGGGTAGADEIMEALDGGDAAALHARYAQSRYARKFVDGREGLITSLTQHGDLATPRPVPPLHFPGQTLLLLHRQLVRRWRDLASLGIQLGQAPVLGFMVGEAFRVQRINSTLFLLGFISLWFGANASARELVSERVIFRREKRGGVSAAATLLAKLANHGLMLLVQTGLLLLCAHLIVAFDLSLPLGWLILWLCGVCGVAVGFVISALAKTEIAATAATPLVLIPLILFGGYLAPFDTMNRPLQVLSEIMPSRWGYEALVHAEKFHHKERDYERHDRTGSKAFVEFFTEARRPPPEAERRQRVVLALGILAAGTAGLSGVTWGLLRRLR